MVSGPKIDSSQRYHWNQPIDIILYELWLWQLIFGEYVFLGRGVFMSNLKMLYFNNLRTFSKILLALCYRMSDMPKTLLGGEKFRCEAVKTISRCFQHLCRINLRDTVFCGFFKIFTSFYPGQKVSNLNPAVILSLFFSIISQSTNIGERIYCQITLKCLHVFTAQLSAIYWHKNQSQIIIKKFTVWTVEDQSRMAGSPPGKRPPWKLIKNLIEPKVFAFLIFNLQICKITLLSNLWWFDG